MNLVKEIRQLIKTQKRTKALSLARDVMLVSFGRYGQYVVTLVTVPLCARILGVEGTGMLAVATSAYFFGSILVDFGLSQILAGRVSGATAIAKFRISYLKLRLILLILIVTFVASLFLFDSPLILKMIGIGLLAGGFSSIGEEWVMLGKGEFGKIALFQIAGRIVYLITLFIALPLIRQPWVPMICLALSTLISATLSWWHVGTISEKGGPPHGIRELLKTGTPSAIARILTAGYSQSSAIYYSLIIPVAGLGIFSAGDKIVRAASAALDALGLALLPRMSGAKRRPSAFWANAKRAVLGAFLFGCAIAVALWFATPLAVAVLYGPLFEPAVPVLRWLVVLLPAAAVSSMIMTSVLYVREDSKGVLLGAMCGVIAGALGFAGTWLLGGHLYMMVASVVAIEWVVAFFYILRLRMLKKKDLGRSNEPRNTRQNNPIEEHSK